LGLCVGFVRGAKGLREITRELNRPNIRTPRGKQWYPTTVKRLAAPTN
jgi:hypothetical protein